MYTLILPVYIHCYKQNSHRTWNDLPTKQGCLMKHNWDIQNLPSLSGGAEKCFQHQQVQAENQNQWLCC